MLSDLETGEALNAMQMQRQVLRLLLLGSTGNIGKYALLELAQHAAATGKEMRLIVGTREPEKFWSRYRHPPRCPAVVEPVQCDLADPSSVRECIATTSPNRIFLCLPQALSQSEMAASSLACVDAAMAAGCSHLVRISSYGIDNEENSQGDLGAAHKKAEVYCKAKGLPLTSIRCV